MGTALETGLGMVSPAVGVRVLIGAAVMRAGNVRQLLVDHAQRRTLLTVSQAVPEGSVLVDERPDDSKRMLRAGVAARPPLAAEARR